MDILRKIFRKSEPKYYIDTIRVWEGHSFDTTLGCMSYGHPVFVIKERKMFGNDKIVHTFYYTERIEDALNELRKLNGTDFVPNEKAYREYEVYNSWTANVNDAYGTMCAKNASSGIFVRKKK